jgi:hypothetical protein
MIPYPSKKDSNKKPTFTCYLKSQKIKKQQNISKIPNLLCLALKRKKQRKIEIKTPLVKRENKQKNYEIIKYNFLYLYTFLKSVFLVTLKSII